MSIKKSNVAGPAIVAVRYILEDPMGVGGTDKKEHELLAPIGAHLLEVAMDHGLNIEHACGAVCACSTCHVYIEKGMECLSEASEAEEDRVEEAPGLQRNSRLSCQCVIERDGVIVVRVPSWNRNAIKEDPH